MNRFFETQCIIRRAAGARRRCLSSDELRRWDKNCRITTSNDYCNQENDNDDDEDDGSGDAISANSVVNHHRCHRRQQQQQQQAADWPMIALRQEAVES